MAFNTDAGRLGVRVKQMGIVLAPYLFEEAIKAGDFVTQTVLDLEKDYEKKMAAGGATIHTVDVKPFKEKAQNAYVALGLVELKKEVEKVLGK